MKEHRLEQILAYLNANGSVQIADLAVQFGVSPMTIRRDLDELARSDHLVRTHGGALPIQHSTMVDTPFSNRLNAAPDKKATIAALARTTIVPQQNVFLSSGTTVHALAKTLAGHVSMTIVTDAINIAYELVSCPGLTIILIGGEVRSTTFSTTGIVAEDALRAFRFDAAYIGATAVSEDGTVYLGSIAELGIAQRVLSTTKNVYFLVDSTKLGQRDFIRLCELGPHITLVTNDDAPAAYIASYQALGTAVLLAASTAPDGDTPG